MPITELALLTALPSSSSSSTFHPSLKSASVRAMNAQETWFAQQSPTQPQGRAARGVALLQQVEDPSLYLRTGTWDSVEQHGAWQGSEAGRGIVGFLKDEFDLPKTRRWRVEGGAFAARPEAGHDGAEQVIALLDAPVVSQATVHVPVGDKDEFARRWAEVRGGLAQFARGYEVRDGWVVKEGDGEFFIFCGWPTVERHLEFRSSEGFAKARPVLTELGRFEGARHYTRVL
ncbi:hypothetical protein BJ170DRAFT_120284 [Xylariales sp. AK1849]|nr:hypothetical protein BJ170DRAFT_120284 [Xylariales sp. AK1849]